MNPIKTAQLPAWARMLFLTFSISLIYADRVYGDTLDEPDASQGSQSVPDIPPTPDPEQEPRLTPHPDPDLALRLREPGTAPGAAPLMPQPAEPGLPAPPMPQPAEPGLPPPPMPQPAEPPPFAIQPYPSPSQPDTPIDPNKESKKI